MEFDQRLKQLRLEKGLTQVELAKSSGLTQSIITHYEQGIRKPTLERAVMLATALGVSVNELCDPPKDVVKAKRTHRNSRIVKIQELFEKLPLSKQESVFEIVKGLLK